MKTLMKTVSKTSEDLILSDESQYEPEEKKLKSRNSVSLAYKVKVCNMAKALF